MIPEISHRCRSCGASVRGTDALFCHECGKPLSKESETSAESHARQTAVEPATATDAEESERSLESPKSEPQPTNQAASAPNSQVAPSASTAPAEAPGADPAAPHAHRRGDKTRERLHRASGVARGVTRGVMKEPAKRVEKIRHVSTVVIEEASYDPSLRFVLVALGLFVVFVVLLVLSKVMG